jgi:hypothetical protein
VKSQLVLFKRAPQLKIGNIGNADTVFEDQASPFALVIFDGQVGTLGLIHLT